MTFRGDVDGVQDLCHVCRLWREIWEHIVKTDVFALITRLLLHFSVPCSVFRLRRLRSVSGYGGRRNHMKSPPLCRFDTEGRLVIARSDLDATLPVDQIIVFLLDGRSVLLLSGKTS